MFEMHPSPKPLDSMSANRCSVDASVRKKTSRDERNWLGLRIQAERGGSRKTRFVWGISIGGGNI